jgi:site-specific DNA recombinase
MKQRVEKDQVGLSCKLKDLKADKSPFKEYIKHMVPMLENLVSYYRKSDGNTKKKILSCIFSKKIVLEKSKVVTYEFTTPIQVLLNASKVCRGTKKRQELENELLSCMAPQVGLEPTTYGLTVRRSNQLSY